MPGHPNKLRAAAALTPRAVLSGMGVGALLSLCNIYAGLKIGWGLNMSVTAALLSFGFWKLSERTLGTRSFGILENNISQTAASSAAAVSSAGLVAAVPALTLLTGIVLPWTTLVIWTFSVMLVGIIVATGLRHYLIEEEELTFANGIATAETLTEIYAQSHEATAKLRLLIFSGLAAGATKLAEVIYKVPAFSFPGRIQISPIPAASGAALVAPKALSLKSLTFALEPSLMMLAVGALVGLRVGASMLFGAIVAWSFLAPIIVERGWIILTHPNDFLYGELISWLVWPGVTLMVSASLASFALSLFRTFKKKNGDATEKKKHTLFSNRSFILALTLVLIFSVILQTSIFSIPWLLATAGVLLTFILAMVVARVSGETNITPVGAMGKVTQFVFGALSPGDIPSNLMAANVTGGAASQCGDLMHDFKTGHLLGALPKNQSVAQIFGAVAGAIAGSAAYQILVPDPQQLLLTKEWPAPAAATWMSVAEIFSKGTGSMPPGTHEAMWVAALFGIGLALAENFLPATPRAFVPSPSSMGLAFVLPANSSISVFAGALIAFVLARFYPQWTSRFLIVAAAGAIAGESIMGVVLALLTMVGL
ncbi:OPT/YSL family transporter [Myxococcota bacterium]|nr:OPT/YSL family transporter [Myxococcota bacterium]